MKTILTFCVLSFLYTFSFGQEGSEMEWGKVGTADSIALHKTFVELVASIEQKEIQQARSVSLAGIDCSLCLAKEHGVEPPKDDIVPIDTFFNQALVDFVGSPLYKAIKERGYTTSLRILKDYKTRNLPKRYPKDLHLYELWIQTYKPNEWAAGHEGQSHAFQFVKVNNRFRFYGFTSIP